MRRVHCFVLSTALLLLASPARAAISGRVVSPEGAPVAGATVEAYGQETASVRAVRIVEGRHRTPLASARSAADGSFRLEATGAFLNLEANADGFAPSFETIADERPITLVLQPAKVRRGVVVADGKAVPSAVVVWFSGGGLGDISGEVLLKTGPDGAYEVPDPDVWAANVIVVHPDHAPLQAAREMPQWPNPLSHTLSAGVPIEGAVVDEATGRGVVGATLWVGGWPLAKSSSRGAFQIPHAPSGWNVLVAVGRTLVGLATPTAGNINIPARPARSLSGFVRDSKTSQPLGGALVWVRGERTNVTQTATTDARGWYSFPALAAERLMASAALPGYSSVSDEKETDMVDLRKSGSHQRDFSLVRDRRLAGRVQDEQRRPIDNAIVTVGSEGDPRMYVAGDWMVGEWTSRRPTARTGPDGSFAVTFPGEVKSPRCVFVLKEGYAAGRSEAVNLDAEPAKPVVVTLTRGIELRGRVVTPDGTPLSDVAVVLAEDGVLQEEHVPVALVLVSWEGPGWTKTDAAGEFVTHVHPAVHDLAFRRPGFLPKIVQRQELTPDAVIDVVLDPAAEIRGRVVRNDGGGVPGVGVYTMNRSYMGRSAYAMTEADGSFVLADLASGRYELYIGKEQTGIDERRTVEAPSANVLIELGRAATLRGRVLDAKSRDPIPQFTLSLHRESADETPSAMSHRSGTEVSDAGGAFEITDVAAGEWTLTVNAQGYPRRDVEGVQVTAGDRPREGRGSARPCDSQGRPARLGCPDHGPQWRPGSRGRIRRERRLRAGRPSSGPGQARFPA
jgi:carboxypeptidase family protein